MLTVIDRSDGSMHLREFQSMTPSYKQDPKQNRLQVRTAVVDVVLVGLGTLLVSENYPKMKLSFSLYTELHYT